MRCVIVIDEVGVDYKFTIFRNRAGGEDRSLLARDNDVQQLCTAHDVTSGESVIAVVIVDWSRYRSL